MAAVLEMVIEIEDGGCVAVACGPKGGDRYGAHGFFEADLCTAGGLFVGRWGGEVDWVDTERLEPWIYALVCVENILYIGIIKPFIGIFAPCDWFNGFNVLLEHLMT